MISSRKLLPTSTKCVNRLAWLPTRTYLKPKGPSEEFNDPADDKKGEKTGMPHQAEDEVVKNPSERVSTLKGDGSLEGEKYHENLNPDIVQEKMKSSRAAPDSATSEHQQQKEEFEHETQEEHKNGQGSSKDESEKGKKPFRIHPTWFLIGGMIVAYQNF